MKENRRLVITAVVSNLIGKFGKKRPGYTHFNHTDTEINCS